MVLAVWPSRLGRSVAEPEIPCSRLAKRPAAGNHAAIKLGRRGVWAGMWRHHRRTHLRQHRTWRGRRQGHRPRHDLRRRDRRGWRWRGWRWHDGKCKRGWRWRDGKCNRGWRWRHFDRRHRQRRGNGLRRDLDRNFRHGKRLVRFARRTGQRRQCRPFHPANGRAARRGRVRGAANWRRSGGQVEPVRLADDGVLCHAQTATDLGGGKSLRPEPA